MKDIHGYDDKVPGQDPTMKDKLLCAGSAMLEKFAPIKGICDHIIGFHCYAGELERQVCAHHYCSVVNKDMRQCVIYDSDKPDAKLIGVEYIISDNLFKTLPPEERVYWHSHVYEVKSGMLTSPNLPEFAEHDVMKMLVKTYGKTFHFWQIDRGDKLPMGEPKLMMAFVSDDQVKWDLVKKRDELYGVDSKVERERRADIEVPIIEKGADDWYHTGKAHVIDIKQVSMAKTLNK